MTYRLLEADEFDKILEPLIANGFNVPDPRAATVAVALNDAGEIQGFLCAQLAVHFDPLVILQPGVNFIRLKDLLEEKIQECKGLMIYCFIKDHGVARMAERAGFEETQFTVWEKAVQ